MVILYKGILHSFSYYMNFKVNLLQKKVLEILPAILILRIAYRLNPLLHLKITFYWKSCLKRTFLPYMLLQHNFVRGIWLIQITNIPGVAIVR